MVDYNYANFNPRDAGQWQQFKQQGAAGVTGVNAMPQVLGGAVPYTWLGGQDRSVPEIKNWLYPGASQGGGGGGGGTSLQALLGLIGAGADPSLLGLGDMSSGTGIDPTGRNWQGPGANLGRG